MARCLLAPTRYQKLRPAMKASFAAVSIDGTDNGWINSSAEFKTLMSSVGAPARPQPLPAMDWHPVSRATSLWATVWGALCAMHCALHYAMHALRDA